MPPFLCLRRGVSFAGLTVYPRDYFSLPTQRCFQIHQGNRPLGILFSAYAEVFPDDYDHHLEGGAFLCLRRGVSDGIVAGDTLICFSLPTQRCFSQKTSREEAEKLFSAYAEVFPVPQVASCSYDTFLCLRRGVSSVHFTADYYKDFSLPTQRCFCQELRNGQCRILFSAYAEVFPIGGLGELDGIGFSLPTQRCFLHHTAIGNPLRLFSAYAEVFLA